MRQQNFNMFDAMRGRNLFHSYTKYIVHEYVYYIVYKFRMEKPEKMCAVYVRTYVHVPCEFATLNPPHDLRFTLVFHIHCVPTIATTINFFCFFFFFVFFSFVHSLYRNVCVYSNSDSNYHYLAIILSLFVALVLLKCVTEIFIHFRFIPRFNLLIRICQSQFHVIFY